ncbi:MAG: zf-TFIIB domain-containing protein [Desulfomonile tiedjei]|nr:zf-TFIIB domain-containing protein [Desulfomonile tiedjei]
MPDGEQHIQVNAKAFVGDFVAGCPDAELQQKYTLDATQLAKVVALLKDKGRITRTEIASRDENLKIRFGSDEKPHAEEAKEKAQVDLDTGLVLHCPSCGAAVKRGSEHCDYCQAHLDFSLQGKTINCPHCFAKIGAESRFCMRCAKPVQGTVQEGRLLEDRLCPRCQVPMNERRIGDFAVIQCSHCNGFFIPSTTFEMMQDSSERVIFSQEENRRNPVDTEPQVRYVRCPECRTVMNRSNFARISGVIIDSCRGHGLWFDPGELEKIMDFIAHRGLQKAKTIELEELKAEKKLAQLREHPRGSEASLADPGWGDWEGPESGLHISDVLKWIFAPPGR